MKSLALILNGKAAAREDVRAAIGRLRSDGHSVTISVTWEAGDAARFARDAADKGGSVVVAGGGDGTINEVLAGLMSAVVPAPLAILPLGTANDFATSAGIPRGHAYEALKLAASTDPVPVDVGVVNGRPFLNLAVGGFGAEITACTPPDLKHALGGGAYALTGLVLALKTHACRAQITTHGETISGDLIIVAIGNGRQSGGGIRITPKAVINDGQLDLLVIPDHDHARFAHLLTDLAMLGHADSPHFHSLRFTECTIEAERPLQFNLDGEPMSDVHFRFGVRARALPLVLPPSCPLLESAATAQLEPAVG